MCARCCACFDPREIVLASHELFLFCFVSEFYECCSVRDLPKWSRNETCKRQEAGDDTNAASKYQAGILNHSLEDLHGTIYFRNCKDQRNW